MRPSRKRPRTKASAPSTDEQKNSEPNPPLTKDPPLISTESSTTKPTTPNNVSKSKLTEDASTSVKVMKAAAPTTQLNAKGSWYGTWPRKARASTQIAKETILAEASNSPPLSAELGRFESKKSGGPTPGRPPSMYLGKSKETLDITMGGTSLGSEVMPPKAVATNEATIPPGPGKASEEQDPEVGLTKSSEKPLSPTSDKLERPATASGWLGGWLPRPILRPLNPADGSTEHASLPVLEAPPIKEPEIVQEVIAPLLLEEAKPPATSWFGLWSTAPSSTAEPPKEQMPVKTIPSEDTVMDDAPQEVPSKSAEPPAGSSWAFWSTEPPKRGKEVSSKAEEAGQLAISGEPSQIRPEPAKTTIVNEDKKIKSSKRGRPQSVEVDESLRRVALETSSSSRSTPSQSTAPTKTLPPNLLIPSVKGTYRLVENPSILQQIARLFLHGHQQPVKHVSLVKDVPKIKKALAIGIHGLFPAPLLRTVIGQPTGTSIKFANQAAEAIRRWTDAHSSVDCEIEKVALEGEGKIADRVDNLWKLLLNWIDHIRKADFILVACHSQGVPVAVMLIGKLIEFGVVSHGRIGICAMAGVSLGPFADYKSRLFSGSAGELFDFANPESEVSKRYEDSLRIVLKYGVRITYCGSIDDQLVSMESSIFSTVSHPYIFRAVFVDGRIHAPDFLSHLVGFALKLRNLGVSDHGLIRELSAPLAGSLYTGEGHSRLYDDGNVYDLATEYALETTTLGDVPLQTTKYEVPSNANPYVLPWIMRGLLEEEFVKTELDTETTELLKEFDDWKPATKVLKDVKYRLEAVRSKL